MEPLLTYRSVEVSFNGRAVTHDVSFTLHAGEILGIVGESGSGKSTLLKAAMGLLGNGGLVTKGDIWFKGKDLPDLPEKELRKVCGAGIGMIFQDAGASLCPIRTIGEQIYESMSAHMEITRSQAKEKALLLPLEPGCYLMKDEKGEIIYVGKAKALKNRVVSYFRENSSHNGKTRQMVSCVRDFDFIVTGSEFEALVLECSLIKHYRPKYNILLMDDKGYHYIHLTDEAFPRIEAVLQKPQDNGLLIGPYMSAYVVRQTADQVNQVFMLPTCSRKFPQDFRKQRPCLNFYIKRCMGLCQGKVSEADYRKIIDEAVEYIRSGGVTSVDDLEKEMYAASEALDFERAARLRDQISAIRRIADKQTVLLGEDRQMDV